MHHADDVRACLDLIAEGSFPICQGMRESFISNEDYTPVIFEMVDKLRERDNWDAVDKFMKREYRLDCLVERCAI